MKHQYIFFVLVIASTISPVTAMWKQTSGQVHTKRNRVYFKSTATITCDKNSPALSAYLKEHNADHSGPSGCAYYNCDGSCYKTPAHPLIRAGKRPYLFGNGGLLNPTLKEYEVESIPLENGVQVTVKGVVETDGIAPYMLNATKYGQCHDENDAIVYEMTQLEEAILGTLKERSVDRGLSDLTNAWFAGGKHLETCTECIKQEWTSHLGDNNDDGKRLDKCTDIMKRHFPRSVYWPSTWNKLQRTGKIENDHLSKRSGAPVKITLDTFTIEVDELP